MNIHKIKNTIIILILFSISIFLSVQIQPIRQNIKKEFRNKTEVYIPSTNYYKIFSFGFDIFRSDILFMKTAQYIGTYYYAEKLFALEDYLSRITDLDPYFIFPYKLTAFVLPDTTKDGAIKIMEKGLSNNPDSWEIPFYLGYLYLIELEDYEKASKYFDIASSKKGVLSSVEKLSALAKKKAGLYESAITFWLGVLENSNDLGAKKQAEKEINQLKVFISESTKILNYIHENNIKSSNVDIEFLIQNKIVSLPALSEYYYYHWNYEGDYIEILEKEFE